MMLPNCERLFLRQSSGEAVAKSVHAQMHIFCVLLGLTAEGEPDIILWYVCWKGTLNFYEANMAAQTHPA